MRLIVKYLKAAALCASKDPTRFYINGVCVQHEMGVTRIIGTDGHRMFAAKQMPEEDEPVEDESNRIIPSETIKQALAGWKPDTIDLVIHGDERQSRLGNIIFDPIDGTFPDWHRIVPGRLNGKVAQFDPKYVADFGRINKWLGGVPDVIHIGHNGDGAALVDFGAEQHPDCIGVLMPHRSAGSPLLASSRVLTG